MRRVKTVFLIAFSWLFVANLSFAQERTEGEIQSMLLYSFLRYFHWPPNVDGDEIVIGVYGNNRFYQLLKEKYDHKDKNGKMTVIKNLESIEEAESCHIVYLGKMDQSEFETANDLLDGKPVLTVTNQKGMGNMGSCINFRKEEGKVKFELNQEAITTHRLMVSSRLTSIAILI